MSGTFVMGREIVCSVLFVFIALPASQSISAPLATTLLDCDGQQIRNQFTSIFCAQIVVNPEALFAFREEATVSVTRGIPPKVSASAFSDADTFAGLPGGMVNSQADIDALAVGTFTAEISEQSSPPFTPQSFPIIVTIVGSINARVLPGPHGQGEAFAGATVRATGGFEIDQTFEVSTTNGNETVPILQSLARNCSAGCSIEFSKGAAVETFASVLASAHLAGSSFATAEAVIDPFLAFDQAAFDQIHGPNSFVLEDFYVFTFSPNLSAPVPALSQWGRLAVILLAIVLGILALVRSQAPGRQRS